jgi:putative PIN family toxin of toxin-antitoxin system
VRVVLDTNVLIAAFATRGICEDVLRTVLAEHQLVASKFILDELERVLNDKLKMPAARVRELTAFIRQTALIVKPKDPATWPASDPDDQWIVATALCGEAQILVSGDRDLQNAPGNISIEILTPREFWERLK